jgi:DNA-binding XRE family transcriptional regulator
MLELTKKPLTEDIILSVICRRAKLAQVKAALGALECTIKREEAVPAQSAEKVPEKQWRTIEEVFPNHHAGHSLRGLRYREDMTQKQLAALAGVSVQNISHMEHGRRPIGKEMAKRLAKVLKTDWRLLLN